MKILNLYEWINENKLESNEMGESSINEIWINRLYLDINHKIT